MSFRKNASIRGVYFGEGEALLKDFLIPLLRDAVSYDRITSFFTVDSLLAASSGLDSLLSRGGKMRLVIGIHDVDRELLEASDPDAFVRTQIDIVRRRFREGLIQLEDDLKRRRIATLAWMIEDGLLEVKVACPIASTGIFHPKTIILRDSAGDAVLAVGSPNETASGLGGNFEQLLVVKSWVDGATTNEMESHFDSLWRDQERGLRTLCLTQELRKDIEAALDGSVKRSCGEKEQLLTSVITGKTAQSIPALFFVSGAIPALYHHQERAVLDALSRWPVRALFADEVGLGKTFEAAGTISFLSRYCGVRRTLILCPKSVVSQWQEELSSHFGIEAWAYDSQAREFVSPAGDRRPALDGPLSSWSPDVTIVSSQYARGSRNRSDIFQEQGARLPEMLVVDEAHAARVSTDLTGKEKQSQLYSCLARVAARIPHLILATATPMQKDPEEYYALLDLLGLPKEWKKARAHKLADSIVSSDEEPELSGAVAAGRMLLASYKFFRPQVVLADEERNLLKQLQAAGTPQEIGAATLEGWPVFRAVFTRFHPSQLLTIRNTKRSLERIGYSFPTRVFKVVSLDGYEQVERFYARVNSYIEDAYLRSEKAIYPDRRFSDGFAKVSYQQRIVSSLSSCLKSLTRRLARLNEAREGLANCLGIEPSDAFDLSYLMDDDDDISLYEDVLPFDIPGGLDSEDRESCLREVELELADLSRLIAELKDLLDQFGDPKLEKAIEVLDAAVSGGDKVLVFSRYTDTLEAVLNRFDANGDLDIPYGVYTGSRSEVHINGLAEEVDKESLKAKLVTGEIKVVFCSDAASEGLNLQAARVLINVDIPWTAARLEQRIGRIARLGQAASTVEIVNLWYPNSIEAKMYGRVEGRLKASNITVGEYPEVVSEEIERAVVQNLGLPDYEPSVDIRTKMRESTLMELCCSTRTKETLTASFRKQLMELLDERFEHEPAWEGETFIQPNGQKERLTCEAGSASCISLSSASVQAAGLRLSGYAPAFDAMGNLCAYRSIGADLNAYVPPERLIAATRQGLGDVLTDARPSWLPDLGTLDLKAACAGVVPEQPKLWPPVTSIGEAGCER